MNKDGSIGMTLSLKYIPFEMEKKILENFSDWYITYGLCYKTSLNS